MDSITLDDLHVSVGETFSRVQFESAPGARVLMLGCTFIECDLSRLDSLEGSRIENCTFTSCQVADWMTPRTG